MRLLLLLASAAGSGTGSTTGSTTTGSTTVTAFLPHNPLLAASNITVVPSGPELLLPLSFRVVAPDTKPTMLRLTVRDLFAPDKAALVLTRVRATPRAPPSPAISA